MRALLQRVLKADVSVNGATAGKIGQGLLVLLGVMEGDGEDETRYLADRVCGLRIFEDENGRMNKSVLDIDGEVLVVSQFTLAADASHGRRPSFISAAKPDAANALYEQFAAEISAIMQKPAPTGVFGADMKVSLVNDGPVTIWLDTEEMRGKHGHS